jgi:hypothetical protein
MFQNSLPNGIVRLVIGVAMPYWTVYAATSTLYWEYGNKSFSATDVLFVVSSPLDVSFDFT